MQKEVLDAAPAADLSVTIVWLPMLDGDDAARARRAARMFDDPRVRQFYDPQRVTSLTFAREVFPTCLLELLQTVPKNDPIYDPLREHATDPTPQPLWDAVLFFRPGAQWEARAPTPARWTKQFAFYGSNAPGKPTARFVRDDCKSPPVDSDWFLEVRRGFRAIIADSASIMSPQP